ncbi:FAD:protein FMN transferase [bacterium]|nr:FAD:protein FMN transferase [bacterium]
MNITLLATIALAIPSQSKSELKIYRFNQPHMGTNCQIILYSTNKEEASSVANAAFMRIKQLDGIMSDYNQESELRQLCARSGTGPVLVGEDLYRVLARSREVSELSSGAFDVTVGPVVKLWRRARKSIQMPDKDELEAALKLVDYKSMVLDPDKRTVWLKKSGMMLDLGGIAKGYAADESLKVIKKMGISTALVAMGGDIALGDPPPDSKGWKVGIAPVLEEGDAADRYMLLANCAVSTSGDTEQYVELGGKRYSHLLNPKTGIGLTERISVTIVAPHGIDSDSLTKVVSVMGAAKGMDFITRLKDVSCRVVTRKNNGLEVVKSENFPTVHENTKQGKGN